MTSTPNAFEGDPNALIQQLGERLPLHLGMAAAAGKVAHLEDMLQTLSTPKYAAFRSEPRMRHQLHKALDTLEGRWVARRSFVARWKAVFAPSPHTAYELLEAIAKDWNQPFSVDGALRLAELVLEDGGDISERLSSVLQRLLQWSVLGGEHVDRAAELFEYLVRRDAKANPDAMLSLTKWSGPRPFDEATGCFVTMPVHERGAEAEAPSASSLLLQAVESPDSIWLEVLTRVYGKGSTAYRLGARDLMNEVLANRDQSSAWLLHVISAALELGWVERADATTLLSTAVRFDQAAFETAWDMRASFGGALAWLSLRDDEGLSQALSLVRAMHRLGADLDVSVEVPRNVVSMRDWDVLDRRSHVSWTGTMLHKAVEEGSPALVSLLLQLGCDPHKESTTQRDHTRERTEMLEPETRTCFDSIAQAVPGEDLFMRTRREAVSLMLNAWVARRHAHSLLQGDSLCLSTPAHDDRRLLMVGARP